MVYSSSTKKIITHCSTVHPRKDTRIFYKMCLSLKEKYIINLIIADGKNNQILENINIYDIGKSNNRFTRIFKSFFIFPFKAIFINSDIYHIHDPELIPAGLILKLLNKKVIYDIHESYSEDILNKFWIPLFIRNIVSKLFNKFETFATSIFDLNICATDYIKSNIKYNAVTINNYPILLNQKESELPINFDNYFIYVGAISIQRGIIEIIDACIRCKQKLILCGTCENEFIEQIINKYLLENENIIYYGQVDNNFAYKLMKHAISGFLLFHPGPNHNNSLPNKMFEYMANGLPVICSNFPLWKSIIQDNNCGTCINPYEVESIDEAILSVIKNNEMRLTYKFNCLKTINHYNWESQESILFSEYEKLNA